MAELTFKYLGKTYSLPFGFAQRDIPTLKKFLQSFDQWKKQGGTIETYMNLKGRGPRFDKQEGAVWRRLINYAQSGGKTARRAPSDTGGAKYVQVFDELKFPKKDIDTLKTFTTKARWTVQAGRAGLKGAEAMVANPLIEPILNFLKKNPNATETELFSAIRKTAGSNLTNSEITAAAIRAHANGSTKLLMEARKEPIGKFKFKELKDITSRQLGNALGSLYRIFPNQIFRDFTQTVSDFYKDNPTLQKRALDKLKSYGEIKSKIVTELEIGTSRRGGAAFQFDHPISWKALERSGNLEGAIRTNPIAGDVNQFKMKLDKKLNQFQKSIIGGKNIEGNLKKIDTLKNINRTLFGKLAGDFTIDATGKIKVLDYGAKTVLDPTYNIAKALEENIPLGKQIKQKIGGIKPQLTEVLGEASAKTFMAEAGKLKTFFNGETAIIQRNIANALDCGRADGGRIGYALGSPTINCVNTKLTNEPVQSSMRLRAAEGVGRIKNVAQGFLGALGKFGPAAGKFGAFAAAGAIAQPLIKQFMNDDPSTYLTDPDQQAGMLEALIEGERPKPRSEILDWGMGAGQLGTTAAAVPGSGALYKYRRGLSEAKIPKAGPVSEAGLTAGDYLSKHKQKLLGGEGRGVAPQYGKIRAGAGVGMKLLSGMFTPAGLLATEPLRIAQQRREGESWGDIATSPMTWMGPAFAPSMTRIATAGMKKGSLLPKLLRLGISSSRLAAMGPAGWAALVASLGWEGMKQYSDYKRNRGFFASEDRLQT